MNRLSIPGGWYCDCNPRGGYVAAVRGSHLATNFGRVEFPPEEVGQLGPRFVVLAQESAQRFAGQPSLNLGYTLTYEGAWSHVDALPVGTSPCIYDHFGRLHVNDGSAGTQGYRYCTPDNRIVTGDETTVFTLPDGRIIHEWTDLGGIVIAQGHDGGCVVWIDGALRLLEPGDCFFIRAHEENGRYAIAIAKFNENQSVLFWLTRAELAALPLMAFVEPTPAPRPNPQPEPPPMLRTIPMPSRVPQIVQSLYERHVDLAEGDDDQRRALQTLICEQARFELGPQWGAKKADSGRPRSKDSIACLTGGVLYAADCFNGTTRKPMVPSQLGELPGQVFDPVEPVNHLGGVPVPTPIPKPVPLPTGPSLDVWIHGEFPQLVAEYIRKRPEAGEPSAEWAAFQTYRRYVEGWTLERMLRDV